MNFFIHFLFVFILAGKTLHKFCFYIWAIISLLSFLTLTMLNYMPGLLSSHLLISVAAGSGS